MKTQASLHFQNKGDLERPHSGLLNQLAGKICALRAC